MENFTISFDNSSTYRNLDDFFVKLKSPRSREKRNKHILIFYPNWASFNIVDVIVVVYIDDEIAYVFGYQLKEDNKIPAEFVNKHFMSKNLFLVRGQAANINKNLRDWIVVSTESINSYFGVSGSRWTPNCWKAICATEIVPSTSSLSCSSCSSCSSSCQVDINNSYDFVEKSNFANLRGLYNEFFVSMEYVIIYLFAMFNIIYYVQT